MGQQQQQQQQQQQPRPVKPTDEKDCLRKLNLIFQKLSLNYNEYIKYDNKDGNITLKLTPYISNPGGKAAFQSYLFVNLKRLPFVLNYNNLNKFFVELNKLPIYMLLTDRYRPNYISENTINKIQSFYDIYFKKFEPDFENIEKFELFQDILILSIIDRIKRKEKKIKEFENKEKTPKNSKILDETKQIKKDLVNILSELDRIKFDIISSKGGTLNDDLKNNFLNTRKYKELKTEDGDIEALEPYMNYEIDDDDNDMNKIGKLSEDIDNYYDSKKRKKGVQRSKESDKENDMFIIQQINNFENDPKNPLEELAITFDDRIVFIIVTFFIRYITIIMVQWCIDINIIKTFYEGFIYYAIIYIIIFWFIVLFINIDNSFDVKYMNFNGIINTIRTLFYYFYMGTNGITRLLIHTSLIILLIIIPIILNIKNKTEFKDENEDEDVKILNYDERKQLSKSLSLFTMFIWLFTSIIATKF